MPKLPAKPTLKTKLQRELAPLLVPILAEAVHTALVDAGMLQTCLHCEHFNEETEGCAKAGGVATSSGNNSIRLRAVFR